MLPPYVSVSDYGLIAPSMPSLLSEPQKIGFGNQATGRVHKTPGAKKRALRNTVTTRRDSSDSDYMSSSSSISASKSRGGNNSGHNKYRKDGAGEHQCPFENCTYRYNLRRELNRHRNVHVYAGKDKYRCMNCNSGLCRLDSVKRHMEAKGKVECLRKGLYQEFKENGELVRVRKCKPSWYEAAAANAAAAAASATAVRSGS
ncbi:hypothetical protein BC939DRAFT_446582 [Gamsiella multidivaricata]|uniref:uncharacterized protein n=1 Tax=Gamsiella multidivaricata TaxID=101098 RepID=UPI0022208F07|nr:uncharacterized protein BC939DRAFT_446582 [Gamsiella multidivaricata]KAI7826509.1 hypothetical protein BC939DRAFT_446582 [Gamsiella multidivaricata]